jgi:hypothetical protein
VAYEPGVVPDDPAALPGFLREEFKKMQQALNGPQNILWFNELHAEPAKPRNGMDVYADGTDWNPGSGRGRYCFENGSWKFLG